MRFRAVLLDMGGVVLEMGNSRGLPLGRLDWRGREALLAVLHSAGARVGPEELERRLFRPWRREYEERYRRGREASWSPHLKRLRRGTGVRIPDRILLQAWFRPYGETLRPRPEAGAALAELRSAGARLALVSNTPLPGELYRRVLERFELDRHFESFHFSYDSGSRKPSPAMLRAALAALGEPPERAAMVGDRRHSDVAAGRAAGVATVWLRSEDGGGPAPDCEIGSLAELPARLA